MKQHHDICRRRDGIVNEEEFLKTIKHLWRVDDPEWLKERKEQWRYLARHGFSDCGAAENKKYARYFVQGEKDAYISHSILYLLTPFDSPAMAKTVFDSELFSADDRGNLLVDFCSACMEWGAGMPWARRHVQWFIEGVLGKEYKVIEEQEYGRINTISPDPALWCNSYIVAAEEVLKGEIDYNGSLDCIDYFMSALPHANDTFHLKRRRMEELLELVDAVIEHDMITPASKEMSGMLKAREQEIRSIMDNNSSLNTKKSN
ncbi:MAG: hypothetical protein MJA83_00085 [Gammaproteobacteria bacterium]|nr:hypothetical protein [Gammaproteobacteria bacterium]